MSALVRVETEDRVARITLDRPPLNVMSTDLLVELAEAVESAAGDPELVAVVLAGAGDKGFSAGADVADHTGARLEGMIKAFHRTFRILAVMDKVAIARVHGACLGGGAELAGMCDLVVVAEDAKVGLPEIQLACFPPVAAAGFGAFMGPKRNAEWVLTGDIWSGTDAAAAGFANRAVPSGELDGVVDGWLKKLRRHSAAALRLTVRALRRHSPEEFLAALDRTERHYLDDLVKVADMHEGIAAFQERRKPVWRHR